MSALFGMADILNPQFLSREYTKIASLSVRNPMLDFYSRPENYDGDTIEMVVFDDTRTAAPITGRGTTAKTLDAQGATKKWVTPVHAFNEITIPTSSIEFLRQPASTGLQDKGLMELRRQMELFSRQHRALRAVTLAHAFRGTVYYDVDGYILESSSGAATTIDHGFSATHLTQLAHASNGGTDIIGTAWDNPAASILTDLEQIREAAEYDKAPTPRHVWLHTVGKPWILSNTEIKTFVQYQNPQASQYLNLLAGGGDTLVIGDWTFHFYNGTYVGADGSTIRPLIPKTAAIITPDPGDGDWFRHYETSELVPSSIGLANTLEEAMGNMNKVFGDFAYLSVKHNPPTISMFLGMNFFYGFADPNAVWYPTVDF